MRGHRTYLDLSSRMDRRTPPRAEQRQFSKRAAPALAKSPDEGLSPSARGEAFDEPSAT